MRAHAHEFIALTAAALANKLHTEEALNALLFKLVTVCIQPERQTSPIEFRHRPVAGEVLPPHQRASWARQLTEYDYSR